MKNSAKDSLCWTCKFGICVQEFQQEQLIGGMHPQPNENDPFGINAPFEQEESEEQNIVGPVINMENTKTVCFWRPATLANSPPILMTFVKSCNRYEKQ